MRFLSFENELRPGVVMSIVSFFYLQQVHPSFLDMVTLLDEYKDCDLCDERFCKMFADPRPASSSNDVNNVKLLFSESHIIVIQKFHVHTELSPPVCNSFI